MGSKNGCSHVTFTLLTRAYVQGLQEVQKRMSETAFKQVRGHSSLYTFNHLNHNITHFLRVTYVLQSPRYYGLRWEFRVAARDFLCLQCAAEKIKPSELSKQAKVSPYFCVEITANFEL